MKIPIRVCAKDGALVPTDAFAREQIRNMPEGMEVSVVFSKDRSARHLAWYFSELARIYENLPESMAGLPWTKSVDAMRKHALIARGYCTSSAIVAYDESQAERLCKAIVSAGMRTHGYVLGTVQGNVTTIYYPESQSAEVMGHDRFVQSVTDTLDWLRSQIGVHTSIEKPEGIG